MEETLFWKQVEQVVDLLKKSNNILIITGAGISADSGLPTYRGVSGLYDNQTTDEGFRIETALSGSMFKENPDITWKYISQIEENCRGKSYNRAHEVLAEMEDLFERVCILTQNVDGFHHKAGSTNIIDIHGNLNNIYCTDCDYQNTVQDYGELESPPSCPKCNGVIRPDIVLFDEVLSEKKIIHLTEELQKGFDLVFSIGTTSVFPYIVQPVVLAHYDGVPTVEINPADTTVTQFCSVKIPGTAAKTMNAIWLLFSRSL